MAFTSYYLYAKRMLNKQLNRKMSVLTVADIVDIYINQNQIAQS